MAQKVFINTVLSMLFLSLVSVTPVQAAPSCHSVHSEKTLPAEPSPEKILDIYIKNTPRLETLQVGIKPLLKGEESLAARLALIERAHFTLDVSSYIFAADDSSFAVLNALKKAAQRGVKIRILVDGAGSFHLTQEHFQSLMALNKGLAKAAVEIKVINPLFSIHNYLNKLFALVFQGKWNYDIKSINNRSHEKILLADVGSRDSWMITGGRNIADEYFGISKDGKDFTDYDVLIKGGDLGENKDPLIAIQKYYEILFYHKLNMNLTGRIWGILGVNQNKMTNKMSNSAEKIESHEKIQPFLEQTRQAKYWEEGFESTQSVFVSEIQNIVKSYREEFDGKLMTYVGNRVSITRSLFDVLALAKNSMKVISPFGLLRKEDVRLIGEWLKKNPQARFELCTNSMDSMKSKLIYFTFYNFTLPRLRELQRDPEIGDRLRVYLYQGPHLHAKVAIADDSSTLVMTSNMDPRSRVLNSEIGFWDSSQANLQASNELFKNVRENSILVSPQGPGVISKNYRDSTKIFLFNYISRLMRLFQLDVLL